jgi:hypothetical protein
MDLNKNSIIANVIISIIIATLGSGFLYLIAAPILVIILAFTLIFSFILFISYNVKETNTRRTLTLFPAIPALLVIAYILCLTYGRCRMIF